MSSSGGRHKRSNKRSSSSASSYAQFPTEWSGWEWNVEKVCWQRYRYKAPDDYEVEYQGAESSNQTSSEPRDADDLKSIPVASGTYQTSENYTTSANAVEEVVNKFSQLATTSTSQSYYASQTREQPGITFSQTPVNAVHDLYSSQNSTQFQSLPNHIKTKNPNTKQEESNPDYRVHKAYDFKWGRVFKVLWVEPKGQGGQASGEDSDASFTQGQGRDGATQFQKVRRFIIINAMKGHCICLPINTYSKQGVTKNGVHAEHHTIVYSDKKPHYIHGEKEKGLTRKPLKIVCGARHKLDDRSRLNYAKTYTVEYNVKVCFIGKVDKKSEWYLTANFNELHPPLEQRSPPPLDEEVVSHAEGGSSSIDYPAGSGMNWTAQTFHSPSAPSNYNAHTFHPKSRALYDIEDEKEEELNEYELHRGDEYLSEEEQQQQREGQGDDVSDDQPEGSLPGESSGP